MRRPIPCALRLRLLDRRANILDARHHRRERDELAHRTSAPPAARASSCRCPAGPRGSSNAGARLRACVAAACRRRAGATARRTRRATRAACDPRAAAYPASLRSVRSLLLRPALDPLRPAAEPDQREQQAGNDARGVGDTSRRSAWRRRCIAPCSALDHDAHDEQRRRRSSGSAPRINAREPQRQHAVADDMLQLVADPPSFGSSLPGTRLTMSEHDQDPAGHEPQTWMTQGEQHAIRACALARPPRHRRSRRRRAAR